MTPMDRRRITSVAVALLAVVVIGVAAASLGRTRTSSGQVGDGEGSPGLPSGPDVVVRDVGPSPELLWFLSALLVALAVIFLIGVVLFPRRAFRQTLLGIAMAAALAGAWWLLMQFMEPGSVPEEDEGAPRFGEGNGGTPGMGDGAGEAGGTVLDPGILGVLLVAFLGLGVLGVLLHRSRSGDERGPSETDEETLSAIGHSAGRAADRIDERDAALDNEVYRAWKEMTAHLDLETPDTRTPGEFRAAALSAGMARADVDALTELFREVRYGGARPTEEREGAATDALRRIEDRYADEEGSR